ncbi:hypothetical protein MMC22_008495 [Lobaria immixta]|nr:hypothetical protein [Lobaria immixta]
MSHPAAKLLSTLIKDLVKRKLMDEVEDHAFHGGSPGEDTFSHQVNNNQTSPTRAQFSNLSLTEANETIVADQTSPIRAQFSNLSLTEANETIIADDGHPYSPPADPHASTEDSTPQTHSPNTIYVIRTPTALHNFLTTQPPPFIKTICLILLYPLESILLTWEDRRGSYNGPNIRPFLAAWRKAFLSIPPTIQLIQVDISHSLTINTQVLGRLAQLLSTTVYLRSGKKTRFEVVGARTGNEKAFIECGMVGLREGSAERSGWRSGWSLEIYEHLRDIFTPSIFEKDLDAPEAKDPANEGFVFIHDYSSLYLEIGGELRNVSQQLDDSLSTIEQWEKREETRGLRRRWSHKNEQRHGGKVRDLAIKCKFTVQQLRVQQGRLREQRRIADQRHSNLVSYKQLQEARTSTQSAADVRLFTYVTIIFLPLSFSSSLFSMAGAPQGSTIYVMVLTTAVALMVTFLLLANLKLMDRHWSFWVNRMNARTRKKMKAREQSQKWKDISRPLEETTQRRLIKSNFKKGLPAESNWWYVKFWLSYTVQRMRTHAHNGVRAWEAYDKLSISRSHKILAALFLTTICVLMLIVYTAITMTVDTIHLQWIMVRQLGTKMLSLESVDRPSKEDGAELNPQKTDGAADGEDNVKTTTKASGSKKSGHLRTAITSLTTWLTSSP